MFDTGSTGFMLVCAMLVLLMTPGLAFFYGGLSRRKNVVNTMLMSFAVLGIVGVTWTVCGWSFAYGGDGSLPFFGGFDQIGLTGLVAGITGEAPEALSHDAYPAMADVVFQLAFCMITTAIITGAVAGRVKFGAVCAFVAVWTRLLYTSLAHLALLRLARGEARGVRTGSRGGPCAWPPRPRRVRHRGHRDHHLVPPPCAGQRRVLRGRCDDRLY